MRMQSSVTPHRTSTGTLILSRSIANQLPPPVNDLPPYKSTCPFCHSKEGYVRGISIASRERTLSYTCDDCKHSWDLAVEAADFPLGGYGPPVPLQPPK